MFGNNFTLFRLFGFDFRANVSWLFLAILVTWSLAAGFFPQAYPNLSQGLYWLLGLVGMVGLFASILFHEFFHAVVARARGLPIQHITLFIFGGVAEMKEEPPSANTEFRMAIAGPLASVLLAGVFWVLRLGLDAGGAPGHWVGVPEYLAYLNLILAAFNMVPAFPLDGGRVLRSALWQWKGDILWATRVAAGGGRIFGWVLIALGLLAFLRGNIIGGMWWVLIGMFLNAAAASAYQRLVMREELKNRKVGSLMTASPVSVPPHIPVRDFVDDYLYHYTFDLFPVTRDDRLIGCVGKEEVRRLPRDEWTGTSVQAIARACTPDDVVEVRVDAARALDQMQRTGKHRLLVTENGRLVGILVLKDLLHHLSLRQELGEA